MIRWWDVIRGGVLFCTLLLMIASCDNSSLVTEPPKQDREISQIDGEPIVKLKATEFYHGSFFDGFRDKLAKNQGSAIIRALNEPGDRNKKIGRLVSVKELNEYFLDKEKAPDLGSTHFRVIDPDGESEDFVLSLRRYHKNPAKVLRKGSTQLKASTTYLALSPDRFYLQDDENGNEQWPVTFPAVSLDDPTDKISLTFNKAGFESSSLSGSSTGNAMASEEQPDIVFAEAHRLLNPMIMNYHRVAEAVEVAGMTAPTVPK